MHRSLISGARISMARLERIERATSIAGAALTSSVAAYVGAERSLASPGSGPAECWRHE
jgi:hypothetical protein